MVAFPANRAFVVCLGDQTGRALCTILGRVEHDESGHSARFSSREELWMFNEKTLRAESPEREADRRVRRKEAE